MTRITFRNTDDSGEYEIPINPFQLDANDSTDYELIQVLDGSPIRSVSTFDGRVRTMKWPFYPVSNSTFMGMLSTLKGYKGLEKKLNLGTIDDAFSYDWRNIKVLDIATELKEGGDLRLGVTLTYTYTESY